MQHIPAARRSFVPARIILEIGGTKRQGFVQSRWGGAADHASRVVGTRKTADSRLYVKAVIQQTCNAPARNEARAARYQDRFTRRHLCLLLMLFQHISRSEFQKRNSSHAISWGGMNDSDARAVHSPSKRRSSNLQHRRMSPFSPKPTRAIMAATSSLWGRPGGRNAA